MNASTPITAGTLMVMAGGTGGHVFPGLAVAHWMQARGWRVVWLGNSSGMEATLVPKHGIPMEYVRFGGVRGKGIQTKLMLPVNLLRACTQSLKVLRRVKPDVVLGMGGYITFPAGLMSKPTFATPTAQPTPRRCDAASFACAHATPIYTRISANVPIVPSAP